LWNPSLSLSLFHSVPRETLSLSLFHSVPRETISSVSQSMPAVKPPWNPPFHSLNRKPHPTVLNRSFSIENPTPAVRWNATLPWNPNSNLKPHRETPPWHHHQEAPSLSLFIAVSLHLRRLKFQLKQFCRRHLNSRCLNLSSYMHYSSSILCFMSPRHPLSAATHVSEDIVLLLASLVYCSAYNICFMIYILLFHNLPSSTVTKKSAIRLRSIPSLAQLLNREKTCRFCSKGVYQMKESQIIRCSGCPIQFLREIIKKNQEINKLNQNKIYDRILRHNLIYVANITDPIDYKT